VSRRRGQPYGADLRDRVLAASGETIRAIATRFSVSPSYVSKVRARLRQTGEATPGPQHNHVRPRLVLLCHNFWCCIVRWQQGHRGRGLSDVSAYETARMN